MRTNFCTVGIGGDLRDAKTLQRFACWRRCSSWKRRTATLYWQTPRRLSFALHPIGQKMMRNCQEVRGAKCKTNTDDIFLGELSELMPITSPRALRSGPPLLPGLMGASVCIQLPVPAASKRPTGADDSFGNAEKHGITGIADGQNVSPCRTVAAPGERKMREALAESFCQSNIKVGIDIHNFGFPSRAMRRSRADSQLLNNTS